MRDGSGTRPEEAEDAKPDLHVDGDGSCFAACDNHLGRVRTDPKPDHQAHAKTSTWKMLEHESGDTEGDEDADIGCSNRSKVVEELHSRHRVRETGVTIASGAHHARNTHTTPLYTLARVCDCQRSATRA